jgi:hypothetical protein
MKLGILSAAMVLAMAAPSMARQAQPAPVPRPAISTYCATIEPGNPFSKVYDYMAWSAWRAKGDWDARGSNACARNPLYSPPGTPTFRPIPFPNPSWF